MDVEKGSEAVYGRRDITMKRAAGIFYALLKANVQVLVTYRINFLIGSLSSVMWAALAIVSITVLTYRAPEVGGWSRYQLFVVQGVYSVIFGIMYTVFVKNFENLSHLIRKGDLDFVLLKPCDNQLLVSVGQFAMYALARIVTGIVLIVYALNALQVGVDLYMLLVFLLFTLSSIAIVYSLWFMIVTTSIWFVDLINLSELLFHLTGVTRYPLEILRYISIVLMYVFLPLVVVTTVPARVLIRGFDMGLGVWSLVLALSLLFISRKFWKFALRYYTSASS
jgi:ABC-2 type transport system permease protein